MFTWYRNAKTSELLKYLMKGIFKIVYGAVLIAGLWLSLPRAADAYTVDIHGYGNQDFIASEKNQYLNAQGGTWEQHSMSLIFTAGVTDDTTVWARLHHDPDSEATVDWLWVEKKFGQEFTARVGSQKYPLGIYNLYAEDKFLEVSELEPMMYSEHVDHMIFDIFNGVDVEYNNGTIGLELFGGGHEEGPGILAKNMFGVRIPYKTPIDGLTLIASGASFDEQNTTGPTTVTENQTVFVGSFDYVNHDLDLKAEFAQKKMKVMDITVQAYYLQAGYTIDKLIPYARYDVLYADTHQTSDPSFYMKDAMAGLGYKINDHLKVKAEEHFIDGYNVPVQSGEVVAGTGQKSWTLFVTGVDFIF